MTNQEIFELLSRFENSSIRTMKLVRGDFSIEVSKEGSAASAAPAKAEAAVTGPAQPSSAPADEAIPAPLAGVFYAASEPGAKPYVAVGDRVKKGDILCLMEAMKTISEITAPCDGVITAIEKENGALAAYGDALMRYRPC